MLYTVIGVWQDDEPVVVGVIEGDHQVSGGGADAFPEGLWATCVDAYDATAADCLATSEMSDNEA